MSAYENYEHYNYTERELLDYGDRLHINTTINVIVNGISIYIVIKHSTDAMKTYKKFILFTIISAFMLDIHVTFIFGPILMLPSPVLCGMGFVSRHGNYLWGHAVPYSALHVCLGFVAFSIIYSLLYQYYSLDNKVEFMLTIQARITMLLVILVAPFPSILSIIINYDHAGFLNYIQKHYPNHFDLFSTRGCYMSPNSTQQLCHNLIQISQVLMVAVIVYTISYKLNKKLNSLKHVLSPATMKARRQFFIALLLQFTVPSICLLIPLLLIFGSILTDFHKSDVIANVVFPLMSLHSPLNALMVMLVITPFRQALRRWFCYILRIKPPTITAPNVSISAVTSANY